MQRRRSMGYRHEMTDPTTNAAAPAGWTFSDSGAMDWQPIAAGAGMKVLGIADGKMIATFKFEAGYVGGVHHHEEPEFSYILEGSMVSQGVQMEVGHAYAAQMGTTHDDFRTENGCTLVSVFKIPG
jgi:mannose-6-phosphate isomerase-like protein (cupin superfamily)